MGQRREGRCEDRYHYGGACRCVGGEEAPVAVEYKGDALEMGFNVSYLQDVMSVLDTQQVKMTLSDANSSALLEEPEGGDAMYVVMPMRL